MILFKNCNLYGEGIADILVCGSKIEKIGTNIDIEYGDLERIDFEGRTVIPSLIDQHVHIIGGGGEGGMNTRCPELNPADILSAGVSTIVGLLGTDSLTRSVENLLAKTKELRQYGFKAYCLTGAYAYPSVTLTGSVMKDIAFIDEIIGVKIAINDHRDSHISYDELKRLAADVRMAGLIGNKPGVVHVHTGSGKNGLKIIFDILENEYMPAKVFRPTHLGTHMEDAVKLAKMGTFIDFTTHEDSRKTAAIVGEALRRVPEGTVTMSSDSNGSMPKWNEKREIVGMDIGKISTLFEAVKGLVKYQGFSLREALRPCTENAAKALNLYPNVGTVSEGSSADFLVLDDDMKILHFYMNGTAVVKDGKRTMQINFME